MTSAAQTAAAGGNRDLEVDAQDENNDLQWKRIDPTRTNWSVTYYRLPYLNGSYKTDPSVTAFGGTFVNSHNVTLTALGGDTDGENVQSGYEIWNWPNGSFSKYVGALFSPYTNTGGAYTYPGLPDGTYAWRGVTHSQEYGKWSGWSPWTTFTVLTTPPATPDVESAQFPEKEYGGAASDKGNFTFTTGGVGNVAGYIFQLDSDLGGTLWSQQSQPPTWNGTTLPGHQYWVGASNTAATVSLTPTTVGPHRLFVKAVNQAGLTSAEKDYWFWAGVNSPTYVYGDQLVNGYTATAGTAVPKATWSTTAGANVAVQDDCCAIHWADGHQAFLNDGTGHVAVGDTAAFRFYLPSDGVWDLGANLTQSMGFGTYTLTLDQGAGTQSTLITGFDGFHQGVTTTYRDFGPPRDAQGNPLTLRAGIHTITLAVTGKNPSATAYKAGIDVLRLAPMSATCTITDLSACRNNVAISPDSNPGLADADGNKTSLSAAQLTAAGWTSGSTVTVNGAPMTLPAFGNPSSVRPDNILAGGQTVNVNTTGTANNGNAVEFLAFGTYGSVTGATGHITYNSNCGTTPTQPYKIDNVQDWTSSSPTAAIAFPRFNSANGATMSSTPHLFVVSVPLACPGSPISSITLPVVTTKVLPNWVSGAIPPLHILSLGIRPASFTDATANTNWTGSWAAQPDTTLGTWTDQTLRIPAHLTIGADQSVRIRLSNSLGTTPVTFPHVSIAQQAATGGPAAAGTPVPVTFGGKPSVTMPAGADAVSDPIALAVPKQSTVLVSLQLSGAVSGLPAHVVPNGTVYATSQSSGDHTGDASGSSYTVTLGAIPYLSGIDTVAPGTDPAALSDPTVVATAAGTAGALVLYGDQTVNSDTASPDGNHNLSDLIFSGVTNANPNNNASQKKSWYGVINEGHNSTTAGSNTLPPVYPTTPAGTIPLSATNPVANTILNNSGVRTVLISTGTDDILNNASADTVEQQLISTSQQARSAYADFRISSGITGNNNKGMVTVYIATIPPNPAFTPAQDGVRQYVNNFILCGITSNAAKGCANNTNWLHGNADGAINFAAAVSTDHTATGPIDSTYLDPAKNPTQAYYQAFADRFMLDSATLAPSTSTNGGGVQYLPMITRTN